MKMLFKFKYGIITSLIAAVCVFFDLLSKTLTDGKIIPIFGDFFYFSSSHNDGSAYGIFAGHTWGLIVVTSIVLVLILVFNCLKKQKSVFYCISVGLIIGGAIGNLFDRIFLGEVRDFIKFSFFSFTFNIADACLTIGVVLFAIYLLFLDKSFGKKQGDNGGKN